MSVRYTAHYMPEGAPPPEELPHGAYISAVPFPLQNVSAYVTSGRVLFEIMAPSDRLAPTIAIIPDYPYYLEV